MVNEKSLENLKPINERTAEEQREICSKGGKARVEQKRQRKNLKETVLALLESNVSVDLAKKYLGDDAKILENENISMQELLSLRLMTALLEDGNAKAYEVLRDTSGQKPREELQVSAEIMTDADRRLLDIVAKRITADDVKSD